MSTETTPVGPYTIEARESEPHNQNFFRVVGPHFIGGWLTKAEADYLCRHLNTAFAAGQASREQPAHPQTEDLEAGIKLACDRIDSVIIDAIKKAVTVNGDLNSIDRSVYRSAVWNCIEQSMKDAHSLSPSKGVEAPPVSEPVAWMQPSGPVISGAIYRRWSGATGSENWLLAKKFTIPLFTHPTKE